MLWNIFKRRDKLPQVKSEIELNNVPTHIAIIPDGNRRWAKLRNIPAELGHREGSYTFKKIVKEAYRKGVKCITFYAFSTENWGRSKKEVDSLMSLLLNFLKNAEKEIAGDDVVIKVIGDKEALSDEVKSQIERVEALTAVNEGIILYLAINYGGRSEIINAVKSIAESVSKRALSVDDISEELFKSKLYTGDYPDPDLLIRTGNELRISNFLPYQMAYTEFYFSDILWPDFKEAEFRKALEVYQERKRRYGK